MEISVKLAERMIEYMNAGAQLIEQQIGENEIADELDALAIELDGLISTDAEWVLRNQEEFSEEYN
jgi:hypothetical protein